MAPRDRDRFDQLAPRDLAITLRSLRRRLGSVQARSSADQLADVVEQAGPSGERLDDLMASALRGAAAISQALQTSLQTSEPVIASAVLDPSDRTFVDERTVDTATAVSGISAEAETAADRIEHASAGALSRDVPVTGGDTTTPLAIGQQLARELINALTAAERHVEWLESQV